MVAHMNLHTVMTRTGYVANPQGTSTTYTFVPPEDRPIRRGDKLYRQAYGCRNPYHVVRVIGRQRGDWERHVVLRYWSARLGWRYVVEGESSLRALYGPRPVGGGLLVGRVSP